MAYAFPTVVENFFETLAIQSARPDLTEDIDMNWNGAGDILTSDVGENLWKMDLTLKSDRYEDVEASRARVNVFRRAGRPFFAHALPMFYPQFDPDGTILGSAAPTLSTVQSNMRDIRLAGLPVGYRITAGDFLSFAYGANPVRYAFHQAVSNGTAGADGTTGLFEVNTEIRPGYAIGAAVRLIKPVFKAIIVPMSYRGGVSMGLMTRDISFTIQQVLR